MSKKASRCDRCGHCCCDAQCDVVGISISVRGQKATSREIVPQIMLNTLVSSTYVVYVSVETKTRLSAARDTSGGKKTPGSVVNIIIFIYHTSNEHKIQKLNSLHISMEGYQKSNRSLNWPPMLIKQNYYPRESFREGLCNHRRWSVCLSVCLFVCYHNN